MKRIYLVRHGETEANRLEYVPNKTEPLNETGQQQAIKLAERVANLEVEQLVVSDFVRAQQTIEPIVSLKGMEPIVVPAFGEAFEPTSIHNVPDIDERVIAHRTNRNANVENPEWRQEDGENFFDLHNRINTAKQYLETTEASSILVVSHAFFIQLFTSAILLGTEEPTNDFFRVAATLKMSNTGISHFTFNESHWRVVMHNDHAHFAE